MVAAPVPTEAPPVAPAAPQTNAGGLLPASDRTTFKRCQNCGGGFPARAMIGGVVRALHRRRYCPTCSPYGGKNHHRLELRPPTGSKRCPRCTLVKPTASDFYQRRGGEPSPYCKPCTNEQTTERTQALKRAAVAYKGGKCQNPECGYDRYVGALQFHHLDPSQKAYQIGGKRCVSLDTIKAELDKTILLCANCHSEAEAGLIVLPQMNEAPAS